MENFKKYRQGKFCPGTDIELFVGMKIYVGTGITDQM